MPSVVVCLLVVLVTSLQGAPSPSSPAWPTLTESTSVAAFESQNFGARRAIAQDSAKRVSDAEIRKQMIADSIASYPGPCACPYQRARNGSSCGRRSAYDRQGGYEVLCYARDIDDGMVAEYRRAHGL